MTTDANPSDEVPAEPHDVSSEPSLPLGAPPPRPPKPKQPKILPVLAVVALVFLIGGVLVYFYGPGADVRPFKSHMDEYVKTAGLKVVKGAPPAVVGKVIVIDAEKVEIDPVTFQLPEDLRPKRDSDVGSIVIHQRVRENGKLKDKEVGTYTSGQYGFVQLWQLVFIDRAAGTIYNQWTVIEGPQPRQAVQEREGSQEGGPATAELIETLKKMPHVPKPK